MACGLGSRGLWSSPLFRFRMLSDVRARKQFGISPGADLGKHLRIAERRAWIHDPQNTESVCHNKYAPGFAPAKVGVEERARARARFRSDLPLRRVFLWRDIVCLLLEKYGGSRLVNERIRNLALPGLDPAKPDQ